MPNATVRANAQSLPEATSRRDVLAAVLAAGAAGATAALPAAAAAPALSAVDKQFLDLWADRAKLKARMILDRVDAQFDGDAAADALGDLELRFDGYIETSVLALGAALMIYDGCGEPAEGLHRAALRAIRPQLIGEIAEDADRMLATATMDEEAAR